ncbi:MAG: NAAT family transporter [Verrucomicrobia bacterium]|nr:NAAT family transporter [Verrucomicrobiota bacterium]MBU6446854.1 NAAT family transporter [Verrucomicrobiota bacterium]MDE3047769.1 NAAT family transporter [Verrucomicrobiota bacterium]
MSKQILSTAFALFLFMDPIGNIPLYISILKGLNPKRQRIVIFRELVIALFIIILFNFVGDGLMKFLHVEKDTIQMAGGIILFLLCLRMIFPPPADQAESFRHDTEPFIVPLAVPLIAGPSVLAAVMIYAKQEGAIVMMSSILIAWLASLIILLSSSFLKKILGWRGITAMERLMGLILILIAVQMFLSGLRDFMGQHA